MKYEYKTVRINVRAPLFIFTRARPLADYSEIIEEYAENGWRFVQIFAPPLTGYGHARFYDLIFERPSNQQNHPYQ